MVVGICRRLRAGEGLTANHCNIQPLILLPNPRLNPADLAWMRNERKSPKTIKTSKGVTWLLDGADFYMTSDGNIIPLNHSHGSKVFGGGVSPASSCLSTPKDTGPFHSPRRRTLKRKKPNKNTSHGIHTKRRGGLCP